MPGMLERLLKEVRFRLGSARHAHELHETISAQRSLIKEQAEMLGPAPNIDTKKIIWIIGSPRTGSTWLSRMLSHAEGFHSWREPMLGTALALREGLANQGYLDSERFVLGEPHKDIWLAHYRKMLLEVGARHLPEMSSEDHLVIKEPNAGAGAPLLLEAFPESCAVFLFRDPRDVVASLLDAASEGSWYPYDSFEGMDGFDVRSLAEGWTRSITAAREACRAHPGPKVMLAYENLLERPAECLLLAHETFGLALTQSQHSVAVGATSWDTLREDQKGAGTFHRKGKAGTYHEDLAPEQIRIVEEVCGPLMKELGYS